MPQKKIPMRMCVACREMREKRQLIRVVSKPDGEICLDFKGKVNGRGAYLCGKAACFEKARKTKALERAFERPIPQEIYEMLEQSLVENVIQQKQGEAGRN